MNHRSRDKVRGVAGVSGAVRETAGCRGNNWTAIGGTTESSAATHRLKKLRISSSV